VDMASNEIIWTATGSIANVKLDYSTAGDGGPWTNIATNASSGSHGRRYSIFKRSR